MNETFLLNSHGYAVLWLREQSEAVAEQRFCELIGASVSKAYLESKRQGEVEVVSASSLGKSQYLRAKAKTTLHCESFHDPQHLALKYL
jgi:hypothetical protein